MEWLTVLVEWLTVLMEWLTVLVEWLTVWVDVADCDVGAAGVREEGGSGQQDDGRPPDRCQQSLPLCER